MSRVNRGTTTADRHDQHTNAGRDSYNQNPIDDLYRQELDATAQQEVNNLDDLYNAPSFDGTKNGSKFINDNADVPEKNTDIVRNKEARGNNTPNKAAASGRSKAKQFAQNFTVKKLKGKTSLVTILAALLFGAGGVSIASIPALAPVQLSQLFTQGLGDQFKAFENRHAYMTRAKFKNTNTQRPDATAAAQRFAQTSDKQVERFANKDIKIERDVNKQTTKMTFPDPDGGPNVDVTSGEQIQDKMQNDTIIRTGMHRAENTWFASMTDKTFKMVLAKLGTSKSSRITGNTNEEREKSVNNAITDSEEIDTRTLTPEVDNDGNQTGRLIGPDGLPMTQTQIDEINKSGRISDEVAKIKPGEIASSVGKGVTATGVADSSCTLYNGSRMVAAMSKVKKGAQAARAFMPQLYVPASRVMAGVATEGEIEFVGNKINNVGGPAQPDEIVDESKLFDSGTERAPPMKANDTRYLTAFDSPGAKAILHNDATPLNSKQARFALAGGFTGTLNKINEYIARSLGSSSPKELSQKCKYIQNPYVRGASLVAGIFIGLGTLGTFQMIGIGASLAISMSLPWILSNAADIASGDMFKNLYGEDFGSGAFVAMATIMGTAAQNRGMKPLSAQEAVAYTQTNKEALARYGDIERDLARAEPFNVYNQYSFAGSLASVITPSLSSSRSSASAMAFSIANLIPHTFASLTKPANAASNIERFQQCPDITYKELGIGADIYCNIRYGLSDKELAIDPIENAKWMASSGNIAPDDDTGEPIDNNQAWNYKKFMDECANRTVGYGEDQEENQGDGSNCLSAANEAVNQRFRVFTMDRSVADYMDGVDVAPAGAAEGGVTGSVSSDGWAYPTTPDAQITSGYKPPDRPDHRGLDMAQPGNAMGKPIFAARDGDVVASGPAQGFGNWIVITHDVDGKKMSTVYGHMRASDLNVKVGDKVKAGQQIARIGSEGQSTGPHLHFEIWEGNRLDCSNDCSINPTEIVEKAKPRSDAGSGARTPRGNEVNL